MSVLFLTDVLTGVNEIDDMKPVMQMSITYGIKGKDGQSLRGSVYHTIHALGK